MQRLIREFEEQLRSRPEDENENFIRVAIPNLSGEVVNGGVFPLADVLRKEERVYNTEFNRWLDEYKLPPITARLQAILNLEDNKFRFDDLVEAIVNEQVVPFVGAGMSQLSGVPGWGALLSALRFFSLRRGSV